jgi:hypothetical protein
VYPAAATAAAAAAEAETGLESPPAATMLDRLSAVMCIAAAYGSLCVGERAAPPIVAAAAAALPAICCCNDSRSVRGSDGIAQATPCCTCTVLLLLLLARPVGGVIAGHMPLLPVRCSAGKPAVADAAAGEAAPPPLLLLALLALLGELGCTAAVITLPRGLDTMLLALLLLVLPAALLPAALLLLLAAPAGCAAMLSCCRASTARSAARGSSPDSRLPGARLYGVRSSCCCAGAR